MCLFHSQNTIVRSLKQRFFHLLLSSLRFLPEWFAKARSWCLPEGVSAIIFPEQGCIPGPAYVTACFIPKVWVPENIRFYSLLRRQAEPYTNLKTPSRSCRRLRQMQVQIWKSWTEIPSFSRPQRPTKTFNGQQPNSDKRRIGKQTDH